jgi:hypothetical protein
MTHDQDILLYIAYAFLVIGTTMLLSIPFITQP